jgi:hypothetical protein
MNIQEISPVGSQNQATQISPVVDRHPIILTRVTA